MSYATTSDVQAINPTRTYDTTTTPTLTHIETYLTLRSAELDVILADLRIDTPVPPTATVSYQWLRWACAIGAAADAESAMFPGSTNRDNTSHTQYLTSRWDQLTKALAAGDINLPDAPRTPTSVSRSPLGLTRDVSTTTQATSWFRGDTITSDGGW